MSERGSLLVSVMFLAAVAGLSAAALDISSWYRTNRKLQAGTDSAALAGAQALPDNPGAARSLAGAGTVTLSTSVRPNDTITVRRTLTAPGFFGRMLGGPGQVEAKATARAGSPSKARWAAPIGVDEQHPMLSGAGCPCWKQATSLATGKVGAGAFRLLNVDGSRGGTRAGTLAGWISDGFDEYMGLGWYSSDTSRKFTSPEIRGAFARRFGSEMLFPIYRERRRSGRNVEYRVVGWAGFHLTGSEIRSSTSTLHGWFERVIWEGVHSESGAEENYGVTTISLVS